MLRRPDAAEEVILMPARPDHHDEVRRLQARDRVHRPPVPEVLPLLRRVRRREVLHRVVDQHHLEAEARDRLPDGPGRDRALVLRLPVRRRARIPREADPVRRTVLLDEPPHLAAPPDAQGVAVRDEPDLPVGVPPEEPEWEVRRRELRLPRTRRHRDEEVAVLPRLDILDRLPQPIAEVHEVIPEPVARIHLPRLLDRASGESGRRSADGDDAEERLDGQVRHPLQGGRDLLVREALQLGQQILVAHTLPADGHSAPAPARSAAASEAYSRGEALSPREEPPRPPRSVPMTTPAPDRPIAARDPATIAGTVPVRFPYALSGRATARDAMIPQNAPRSESSRRHESMRTVGTSVHARRVP